MRSTCESYDLIANSFDRERKPKRWEWPYFERFASCLQPGATVLDCGCGSGHLGLQSVLKRGCRVVGLDGSPAMLALFAARYHAVPTICSDMRSFEPEEPYEGIVAWDSFFHLSHMDQRMMVERFAAWLRPGGHLMFTSGPTDGTAKGTMFGVGFSYASFGEAEYRRLLAGCGFGRIGSEFDEPGAAVHKVWTAERLA